MKGKTASSAGPNRSNTSPGVSRNIHHSSVSRTQGTTSSSATVRWSRRSWSSTRSATAAVRRGATGAPPGRRGRRSGPPDQLQERPVEGLGGAVPDQRARRGVRQQPPFPQQQQPVAPVGLVHDVAAHQHRDPGRGEPVEEAPEALPQHRVQPDGRLVEHEQVRRPEQRDGERGPRALAPREASHHRPGVPGEVHGLDDPIHLGGADAEDPREEAHVLAHRQVVVDARLLCGVADPGAQRRRSGRLTQHGHPAPVGALHADDAAHQRGLAAAGRSEQPGHRARAHGQVEVVQHDDAAATHQQTVDLDRLGDHAPNLDPGARPVKGGPAWSVVAGPVGRARLSRWYRSRRSAAG